MFLFSLSTNINWDCFRKLVCEKEEIFEEMKKIKEITF